MVNMKHLLNNPVTKVILVVIAAFCLFSVAKMQSEKNELERRRAELQTQVTELESDIKRLKTIIAQPVGEEYIIEKSREKLNLHLPDEVIFYNDLSE